ncbi:MAG: DUF6134 family protein [Geminicoccaceae bacterium]
MLDRRSLLAGALALPSVGVAAGAGAQAFGQEFVVARNGSDIGRHRLRFTLDGDRLSVDIAIELEVKLAFVTVYRYRHTNLELWEGDRLLSFTSRTDDNGTPHQVTARRSGGSILVEGDQGSIEAPGEAMPTTYWHRRALGAPVWIDSQNGQLLNCRVAPMGPAMVPVAGQTVAADGFAVTGDLAIDLWYAGERWVKLGFAGPDGSAIEYRLERIDRQPGAAGG